MNSKEVLFVHDGPLLSDDKGRYYGVSFHNGLIERYTFFGEKVTFLMRLKSGMVQIGDAFSEITHESFNFVEIPDFKSLLNYHKKKHARRIIEEAVKKHDIVIVRLPSAAGAIAFNYAKEMKKPVLVECVACVFDALWNYSWKGKLMAHYKYYQNRQLLRKATHTIYVTNEFLQSRYPTRGKAIACSDVVLKEFDENVLSRRLQKIDQINEKKSLVMGTVAALNVPYKGQADVIRAVGSLKKEGVKVVYKLVGQGDPGRLQKVIKESGVEDRVEIIGPLPHQKVFDFLDEIDVYIQPSRQEGLPRAVVEAMSRACLVMGANTAGIPELIEQEFVFVAGDTVQIKTIIKRINGEIMTTQAKRNFEESKEYQNSVLNRKRASFYEEFINDHNFNFSPE